MLETSLLQATNNKKKVTIYAEVCAHEFLIYIYSRLLPLPILSPSQTIPTGSAAFTFYDPITTHWDGSEISLEFTTVRINMQ